MNIGDEFLVSGSNFYEKAKIIEKKKFRDKKVYLLSNNILINRRGEPVNSKFTIEPYSEEREKYFKTLHTLPKKFSKVSNFTLARFLPLDEKSVKTINKKLDIILDILGL